MTDKGCCFFPQRISAYDRLTNAVRLVIPDVMNTAAAMDAQLEAYVANGTDLPLLFCVPILLKDNYDALDGEAHDCQNPSYFCCTTCLKQVYMCSNIDMLHSMALQMQHSSVHNQALHCQLFERQCIEYIWYCHAFYVTVAR